MLRESYLLDTLECGDFSFATACLLANRKYGKNTQRDDIKSHQYIISFDPRDAADNGLTMEKAQTLGLKFCEENFPGHPAIVCTHPDGHNHSGNIHVHIVIGSIRTREVERKLFMQKPRDWREGMKHSSTAQTMRHLRVEVMELCEGAGLYQIDLLNGSKERVSEAEYWARRRGQMKLDRENAALTAAGQPPQQKKFETVKDTLRKQISSVLYRAVSLEDFSDRLMQQYGIAVKESRGQLSYLPAGRAKFIRAKHLGDKFDKAAVLATLQANAEHKPKVQSKPTNLAKLIDIQAKLNEGKLYDLTTLQREANRLFGFTAKQTLDYAQQLYEKKLLTYPRTDSQYLTEDMGQTAHHLVADLLKLLSFAQGLDLTPEVGRALNSKKVSDHHAIIPTAEFAKQGFTGLAESECKVMNLVCSKLLCAVAAPYEYETVTSVFSCTGNEFTAKGKTILVPGWKEIDQRFRSTMKADREETEILNTLPELAEGQSFSVTADVSEHFTSPPKAYTEDTILSAMERAGAEDMPEAAERKGLGTPATRAAILEKLVQMGFVQRKGKQLVPTKDGINLAVVLPESLTSPALTAEWENRLTEIAKGNADPDEFMAEIEAQVRQLVKTYSCISADKQNLFQSERVIIGKCPRCGEKVYEGKKNFYCGNRGCQFVMWKNDRFFEQRKKAFTPKIAAALLKNGKTKVKGLYSEKTGKTYDATVLLADTGGKYVNYRVERKE